MLKAIPHLLAASRRRTPARPATRPQGRAQASSDHEAQEAEALVIGSALRGAIAIARVLEATRP